MNTTIHIKELLESNSLAAYKALKFIPRTCSKSDIIVLDYDFIKDTYCKGMKTIKSADCLHLNEEENIISFIEMKDISQFIKFTQNKYRNISDFNKKFKSYKNDLRNNLRNKIVDSITMLISAMGYYSCDTDSIKNILSGDNTKIKYIVMVNMSAEDYLTHSLSTLSIDLNFRILYGGEVMIIRSATFDKSPCI